MLRTIESEHLLENAASVGDYLSESLSALRDGGAPIDGVRGRGLMLGVALRDGAAPAVARAALQHGVIVNAVGTATLRLVPPLTITRDEVDEAMRRLAAAFADVAEAAGR